jgi:hypothetical protein
VSDESLVNGRRMRKAFLRGMGSVLELFSIRHYPPGTLRRSDAESLRADFDAVAGDMQRAIDVASREAPPSAKSKKPRP